MKKKSKNMVEKRKINKYEEKEKSPEYYSKLYTYILRDLSENIKDRTETNKPPLNDENVEVNKVWSKKKLHQQLKSY
ncbi:MAG: hypothetical protein ACXABO_16170 [Promethearchaeota archaeon]